MEKRLFQVASAADKAPLVRRMVVIFFEGAGATICAVELRSGIWR